MLRGQQKSSIRAKVTKSNKLNNKSQLRRKTIQKNKPIKSTLSTSMASFSTQTNQNDTTTTNNNNTTTTTAPKSHENGFDVVFDKLHRVLASQSADHDQIYKDQRKSLASFDSRSWEVKDTLTIMPHFLQLIQPDGAFARVAIHRVANLRSQLKKKNEERIEKAKEELDSDTFNKQEVQRELWNVENTIDLIPIQDFVRIHMQVVLSALQYVNLSYQNYCRNTFGFDESGLQHLDTILTHLETIPQLTFYRMHYQQALLGLTTSLTGRPHELLMDSLESMDADTMQAVFLKRFAFARSEAFKESIKKAFKNQNVLADTTMLPLTDPTNVTKQEIITNVMTQCAITISNEVGIKNDAIGHLLLEIELAMGCRFPKEPKHILHVKSFHTMTKIAKMPQNPQILSQYIKIINSIQLPQEREAEIMKLALTEKEQTQALYQERVDSSNFISTLEEIPLHFPEELWVVPVTRQQRVAYFKENPDVHAMWSIYNKIVATATTADHDLLLQEQLEEQCILLEKSLQKALNDDERASIDERLASRRNTIQEIQTKLEQHKSIILALDLDYQTKAQAWKERVGGATGNEQQQQKPDEESQKH